jgi:polyisoprenoid-binding protein YceI
MRKLTAALCVFGLLVGSVAFGQDAGQRYAIDTGASDLHWLVYKAGTLSRLGHNHTIAVTDLHGSVWKNDANLAASRFEMEFSVAKLVIDDPALRATLGADFSSVPTAKDIEGTRGNMLGDRVLDGEKFPTIRIVGTGPAARDGAQTMAATVEILGRSVPLTIPTHVAVDGDEITATGEFELNHADLGMKPFTVMLGALAVGEKLSFNYTIKARREAH